MNLLTGKLERVYTTSGGSIKDMKITSDSRHFTTVSYDRYLRLYEVNKKNEIGHCYLKNRLTSCLIFEEEDENNKRRRRGRDESDENDENDDRLEKYIDSDDEEEGSGDEEDEVDSKDEEGSEEEEEEDEEEEEEGQNNNNSDSNDDEDDDESEEEAEEEEEVKIEIVSNKKNKQVPTHSTKVIQNSNQKKTKIY